MSDGTCRRLIEQNDECEMAIEPDVVTYAGVKRILERRTICAGGLSAGLAGPLRECDLFGRARRRGIVRFARGGLG